MNISWGFALAAEQQQPASGSQGSSSTWPKVMTRPTAGKVKRTSVGSSESNTDNGRSVSLPPIYLPSQERAVALQA
jgi:hypothetical protein